MGIRKMKNDEVYGDGNAYTAEFWEYDSRTARRWNSDPLFAKYAWQSLYSIFNNSPISKMDSKGLETETPPDN